MRVDVAVRGGRTPVTLECRRGRGIGQAAPRGRTVARALSSHLADTLTGMISTLVCSCAAARRPNGSAVVGRSTAVLHHPRSCHDRIRDTGLH